MSPDFVVGAARFGSVIDVTPGTVISRRPTFTRSPAQGTTTGTGRTVHDEIVVFEVMTETLDAGGGGITEFSWSVPAG
jgi:hypothetical protein